MLFPCDLLHLLSLTAPLRLLQCPIEQMHNAVNAVPVHRYERASPGELLHLDTKCYCQRRIDPGRRFGLTHPHAVQLRTGPVFAL